MGNILGGFLILTLLSVSIIGCVGHRKSHSKLDAAIYRHFQDSSYTCQYNSDSSYVCCSVGQHVTQTPGLTRLELAVFHVADGKLIHHDKLNFGQVKWVNDHVIEMKEGLGYAEDNQNAWKTTRFNVKTKTSQQIHTK